MKENTRHSLAPGCAGGGLFLLQMAGQSGVGKSAVARQIATRTGAAVLDLDQLKSTALDAGADWDLAGKLSYQSMWMLADSLLGQGFSVILDSPCRFERIVAEGTRIARVHNAVYCFIECVLPDRDELRRRLRSRPRLRSQMTDLGVSSPDAPADATAAALVHTHGPAVIQTRHPASAWLALDTRQDPGRCVTRALGYLDACRTR
ncbi:AAA family ATPase [Actinopolymorpha alba]|uniref:AAA family ATPase n=1 Tax=Actinopolymorpha alba TaxID=533267 RepID=UPI0003727215|nr:AAA family ATPase [Actinopolymorpha alba]